MKLSVRFFIVSICLVLGVFPAVFYEVALYAGD